LSSFLCRAWRGGGRGFWNNNILAVLQSLLDFASGKVANNLTLGVKDDIDCVDIGDSLVVNGACLDGGLVTLCDVTMLVLVRLSSYQGGCAKKCDGDKLHCDEAYEAFMV